MTISHAQPLPLNESRRHTRQWIAGLCAGALVATSGVALAAPDDKANNADRHREKATLSATEANARNQQRMDRQQNAAQQLNAVENQHAAQNQQVLNVDKILGQKVLNQANEEVGTLKDIVINTRNGSIDYAVLSHGGLWGIGNELYALPWSTFSFNRADGDADKWRITAAVTKAQLEKSQGFDQNNWPNMADESWSRTFDNMWGREDAQRTAEARQTAAFQRASKIIGMNVKARDDKSIGEIKELNVTERNGRVAYAVIDAGGFLDGKESWVAVPWSSLQFDAQGENIRLDSDKRQLQPLAFDKNNRPDVNNSEWSNKVHRDLNQDDAYLRMPGLTVYNTDDGWKNESRYNKQYNGKNIKTIAGEITEVNSIQPNDQSRRGTSLEIETSDGSVRTVHLGPTDHLTQQGVNLREGQRVTIIAAQADRRNYLLAQQIEVDGKRIELRDKNGAPQWDRQQGQTLRNTGNLDGSRERDDNRPRENRENRTSTDRQGTDSSATR